MTDNAGTVLVVGAAGFVGGFVTPALRAAGWVVRTLDKVEHQHSGAQAFVGDVRAPETLRSAMAGCDLVINLAAEHRDDVIPTSLYKEVNVDGARNVCAVATACGVRRQIFTSSVAVYGSHARPIDENTDHVYFNEYGRTKHLAEIEYETWCKANPANKLAVVRPTVIFGPGNRGNVFNLLRQLKRGPFVMFGNGKNIKSMACVENLSAFLVFLANEEFEHLVVNYADKPDFTMLALVGFVDEVLGRTGRNISLPGWVGLVCGHAADVVARMTGRTFPVSGIRVRKFMMNSEIVADRAALLGFRSQTEMKKALRVMLDEHV